ncbi:MAG: hypothetical protein LBG59_05745 [Candidatus Peribacteria bacterium]|jgi:hypothetical protein|nr:hypothetical protein [Candidatus Peribacteria bacterium]
MKTFLRTTLFWLVASIAFLIVSGFGYGNWRITPVFDQLYLVKRLPSQVVQTIELQGWDRALQEQSNNEIPPLQTQIEEVADTATLLIGQTNLSQQMNEHFIQLSQQLSQQFQSLITLCQGDGLTLGQVSDETG